MGVHVRGGRPPATGWDEPGRVESGCALGSSDVEPYRLDELLALADAPTRALWDGLELGYTAPGGHPLLRAEIASLAERLEPRHVLTFAGADEAILVTLTALLGPGTHAVVVTPCYAALAHVPAAAGAEVTRVPLDESAGWALDLDAVRRALRPSTRAVVVNFPHNPTGALPSPADLAALVGLLRGTRARLVSDEVYRLLEHDPRDRLPTAADLDPGAVAIGVMSKAFGLAGLRVGWLATRDEGLLRRAAALKEYGSGCNSAPSEILALIALRAREAVLARSRRIVLANVELFDRFVAARPGLLAWQRPRAGSVGFPRLVGGRDVERFCAGLAAAEGLSLAPGSRYGHDGERFRLGFGRAGFGEALGRVDRFAGVRAA